MEWLSLGSVDQLLMSVLYHYITYSDWILDMECRTLNPSLEKLILMKTWEKLQCSLHLSILTQLYQCYLLVITNAALCCSLKMTWVFGWWWWWWVCKIYECQIMLMVVMVGVCLPMMLFVTSFLKAPNTKLLTALLLLLRMERLANRWGSNLMKANQWLYLHRCNDSREND